MKPLILFPPQWIPISPHLAGPAIVGMIKSNGYEARLRDLNALFYNTVLTPEFLYEAVKNAFEDFRANAGELAKICPDEKTLKTMPEEFRGKVARFRAIKAMADKNHYREVIGRIGWAVEVLRDSEAFYQPKTVDQAVAIITEACAILSATHHPSGVFFLQPNVKIYYSVESLRRHCENVSGNIFHGFYARILPELLADDPQFIGISLGDYSQLLGGLTLAMMLKKSGCAHVCIGGNLFGRYTDVLINSPEFFQMFADSVIYNEGERPVIELLHRLGESSHWNDVPNLMYLDQQGAIKVNEEAPPYALQELPPPDYSGLLGKSYYLPEPIYNIQSSRSCYWRKCAFCTHHFGSRYAVKPVAQVVGEIAHLQKSNGARYFHFIDEAVNPVYLRHLCQAIVESGLDIRFYIYGRFEQAFDRSLFALAHRAGLRMVLWGFESACERIYRLMNKGDVAGKAERLRILDDAFAEGIWNYCFLMFHFPTETLAESKETVDFVRDHRAILSHSSGGGFMLVDNSPMLEHLEKYSITKVERIRNGFSFAHRFSAEKGKSKAEKEELERYKAEAWGMNARKYRQSSFREKLFLYVCRFGVEGVSRLNQEVWL